MRGQSFDSDYITRRVRACNYLVVAQLFLQDNFLLERALDFRDIKPRLLGHWGTCPGINIVYANLKAFYQADPNFSFILGPGHGFPALQANLFLDGDLAKVDTKATTDRAGLVHLCRNFSWPGGFPSHASPITPEVILEGGELGYALATAYGACLGRPEKTVAVLIGDGEFETATALGSLNLVKLLGTPANGHVLPILHLNGYKISAPTVAARKSERELGQLLRGFGYQPITISDDDPETFQTALAQAQTINHPFLIFKNIKGTTGPDQLDGAKIADNYLAHQIPLQKAKTDRTQLIMLERWLKSYYFSELFDPERGFTL